MSADHRALGIERWASTIDHRPPAVTVNASAVSACQLSAIHYLDHPAVRPLTVDRRLLPVAVDPRPQTV